MTNEEKQEIVNEVLAALHTHGKTIDQLTPVTTPSDSDTFELSGGRNLSYGTLKELITAIFTAALSGYVPADSLWAYIQQYIAKLGDNGALDWQESPVVMLATMGTTLDNVDGGLPELPANTLQEGDMYYQYGVNYQIFRKLAQGAEGLPAKEGVVYINMRTMHMYKWTGSTMMDVGIKYTNMIQISKMNQTNVADIPVGKVHYVPSLGRLVYRITSNETFAWAPSTKLVYIDVSSNTLYRWQGNSFQKVSSNINVVNNLTDGGEGDALSAEMGKKIRQNITILLSRLGNYAFPNGKPTLDWGDGGGGDDPEVPTYSVQKTIGTGLSASGGDDDVNEGDRLEVTIAITNDLYIIDEDNVEVTMDGSPVDGAFDAATGKITIAEVYGEVVINVPSMTYVQDGLVLHLDGKNRGDTTGQWTSLVNYNGSPITFALTGCTENSDNVQFLGNSKGESNSSLPVLFNQGTVEALYDLSGSGFPTSAPHTILCNNTQGGIGLGLVKDSTHSSGFINHAFADSGGNLPEYSAYIGAGTASASKAHVSILQEDGKGKLRYNGVAASDVTLNYKYCQGIDAQTKLSIGNRHRSSGDDYMTGKIFFIRVYSRKLTDAERARNYKIDKQYYGLT